MVLSPWPVYGHNARRAVLDLPHSFQESGISKAKARAAVVGAVLAGCHIRLWYGRKVPCWRKQDNSKVTPVDFLNQWFLQVGLACAFLDHDFFGEEGAELACTRLGRLRRPRILVVDPVDGTLNLKGDGPCCVSVGALHNGNAVFGVTVNAVSGDVAVGVPGACTRINGVKPFLGSADACRVAVEGNNLCEKKGVTPECLRKALGERGLSLEPKSGSIVASSMRVAAGKLAGVCLASHKPGELAGVAAVLGGLDYVLRGFDGNEIRHDQPGLPYCAIGARPETYEPFVAAMRSLDLVSLP